MRHTTVLLHASIDNLDLAAGKTYFDGTLGAAGHASEVFARFGDTVRIIGVDRDAGAVRHAEELFASRGRNHAFLVANYRDIGNVLAELGMPAVDAIMLDLGLSSDQLDASGRGFTFRKDEPLLMTFAERPEGLVTAAGIVNAWREETIADVLYAYADERYARRIAKAIVAERAARRIEMTADLVRIIEAAVPASYRRGRIHCATKTFQALRMAVNDELGSLAAGLAAGWQALAPGGRMAIISFHSAEDRLVKNFFRDKAAAGDGRFPPGMKKPVVPDAAECAENPRARSAKLRVFQKR